MIQLSFPLLQVAQRLMHKTFPHERKSVSWEEARGTDMKETKLIPKADGPQAFPSRTVKDAKV